MARRLIAAGIEPGDRIALSPQTGPEFAALFCGAIYAGAWPVPLPLPTSFGGKESYIEQLARAARKLRPVDAAISRPRSPRWPQPRPSGRAAGEGA